MWIPRKKLKTLVQRMNDLEKQISSLEKDSQDWKLVRLKTELNYEFCKSVAHGAGSMMTVMAFSPITTLWS